VKKYFNTAIAVAGLLISTLSYGTTVSINFDSPTPGSVTAATPAVAPNSFTTLSTDGTIEIGPPLFGGPGLTVLGFSSSSKAIFSFDTSTVAVTSITLGGTSGLTT